MAGLIVTLVVLTALGVASSLMLARGLARVGRLVGFSGVQTASVAIPLGLSLPLMAISVGASTSPTEPGFGLQAVIGSNIINLLLIIGLCGLFGPIPMKDGVVRQSVAAALAAGLAVLACGIGFDRDVNQREGLVLMVCMMIYAWFFIEQIFHRGGGSTQRSELEPPVGPWFGDPMAQGQGPWFSLVWIGMGSVSLIVFMKFALAKWVEIGELLNGHPLSGVLIPGLISAIPHFLFALIAVRNKAYERAMAVVLGSYVLSCFLIVGMTALNRPLTVPFPYQLWRDHALVMCLAAALFLPNAITADPIRRGESALLIVAFVAYVAFIGIGGALPL
jgi:cation:H+ antiporter